MFNSRLGRKPGRATSFDRQKRSYTIRLRRWFRSSLKMWTSVWMSSWRSGRMCRRWLLLLAKVCRQIRLAIGLLNAGHAVARMAKVRSWHDVRLLSFDLQTVEFAYAAVRPFHTLWDLGMTD